MFVRVPLLPHVAFMLTATRAPDRVADERTIREGEAAWAASVASGDTATVERILADDYRGVAPDGSPTDKQSELAETRSGPSRFVSNRINAVHVRFYGDTAVAQGSESWEKRDGESRHGRYVWTDTWVKRDGRWQVVAAEDLAVEEPAPPNPAR